MAINKIVKNSIGSDAIDATKVADDAISEEHLDVTAVTGHTELAATASDDDVLLVFDTSAGVLKKIQRSNIALAAPTFTSVSPTNATTGDGTGNFTFTITGTNFDSNVNAKLRTNGGTDISFDTVTRNSATQLTCVVAKNTSNLTNSNEPFDVVITNGSGLAVIGANQINIDAQPVYTTAAGSLGTFAGGSSHRIEINATDPDSAGNVTFELQSGSLPTGMSLSVEGGNGGTAVISGTATNPVSNTTSNFVLRAVDAASNTSSRSFSITISRTFTVSSFTADGTFAVPSGLSAVDVLVVAGGGGGGSGNGTSGIGGGGGGAGGLVFFPSFPVTASGTIAVTVGNGGTGFTSNPNPGTPPSGGTAGSDSVFGASPSPGLGQSSALTAKGGGSGGSRFAGTPTSGVHQGNAGGSGGGGAGGYPGVGAAGTATQPTQSGNSGAYGFGNAGGTGGPGNCCQANTSGGGGGAGGAGINGNPGGPSCGTGGQGGVGKSYTIADSAGTSPVFYAGGGGGGRAQGNPNATTATTGGNGGGGDGSASGDPYPAAGAQAGTANRGGGGGGGAGVSAVAPTKQDGGAGGKGIVIVKF
jgi:hypothetical protein